MANFCEKCPIDVKAVYCCGSNPETGTSKNLFIGSSGKVLEVCDELQEDGTCGNYLRRPEDCSAYGCEEWISQGLQGSLRHVSKPKLFRAF